MNRPTSTFSNIFGKHEDPPDTATTTASESEAEHPNLRRPTKTGNVKPSGPGAGANRKTTTTVHPHPPPPPSFNRKTATTTTAHPHPPLPPPHVQPKKSKVAPGHPERSPTAGNAPEAEAGRRFNFNYKALWEKYKKQIIIALICIVILIIIIIIVSVILSNTEEGEFDDWEGFEEYQKVALKEHNKLRAKHNNTKPLKMNRDNKLNGVAMKCAQHYMLGGDIDQSCPFRASYGENLGLSVGGSRGDKPGVAKKIVGLWYYDEIKLYDFDNPGYVSGVGHFTQLVWRFTTELGFAVVEDDLRSYIVAIYKPGGNIIGVFDHGVGRLKNSATSKSKAGCTFSCLLIRQVLVLVLSRRWYIT